MLLINLLLPSGVQLAPVASYALGLGLVSNIAYVLSLLIDKLFLLDVNDDWGPEFKYEFQGLLFEVLDEMCVCEANFKLVLFI